MLDPGKAVDVKDIVLSIPEEPDISIDGTASIQNKLVNLIQKVGRERVAIQKGSNCGNGLVAFVLKIDGPSKKILGKLLWSPEIDQLFVDEAG